MQDTRRRRKESGKVQLALLVAVGLAAAGAGVWSEVKAATEVNRVVSRSIAANTAGAWGDISENSDGTAWVTANSDDGTTWVQGIDQASTTYSINAYFQPGQSHRGAGSGTGTAQVAGQDFNTGDLVILDIAISVDGTTDANADIVQSVQVAHDPLTGESSITRVHRIGNTAFGLEAGSLSISTEGVPLYNATGIYGSVTANTTHRVTKIK